MPRATVEVMFSGLHLIVEENSVQVPQKLTNLDSVRNQFSNQNEKKTILMIKIL